MYDPNPIDFVAIIGLIVNVNSMKKLLFPLFVLVLLVGCVESYSSKLTEQEIISEINEAHSLGRNNLVLYHILILERNYPKSERLAEFIELKNAIEAEEEEIEKNTFGDWKVLNYVDEFDEPTDAKYILRIVKGKFSNSATQDSDLTIRMRVNDKSNMDIGLYEYSGRNPVKSYSKTNYSISVQDATGERFNFIGVNYGDRITFDEESSRIIHEAFIKGGEIKFRITEVGTPTKYRFNIESTDRYNDAYRALKEKI